MRTIVFHTILPHFAIQRLKLLPPILNIARWRHMQIPLNLKEPIVGHSSRNRHSPTRHWHMYPNTSSSLPNICSSRAVTLEHFISPEKLKYPQRRITNTPSGSKGSAS